jgi:hypothetical protein
MLGVSPKTLRNRIVTCASWPHEQRLAAPFVGYKHHKPPNSYPPEYRTELIRLAEAEQLTCRQQATCPST